MGKVALALLLAAMSGAAVAADPPSDPQVRTGAAAYGDWRQDAPGVRRLIRPGDLPAPYATPVKGNFAARADLPDGALPKVPAGFKVEPFATLNRPRQIRVAPNGDIFVAETAAGRIRVLRAVDGASKPSQIETFAEGLSGPFGIAFYPLGPDPRFVYIANEGSVVRFPYRNGDLKPEGPAEIVVPHLAEGGGHVTRDIAFSPDGSHLYISVGSGSNDAESMDRQTSAEIATAEAARGLGASWGDESWRANVLVTSPDGKASLKSFADGIRNCVSLAIEPATGAPWCVTNERDALGDDLPPDYATRVRPGAFYGWPWYYIGANEDPRHKGERPDLKNKITVPDVLIQPHSAPLGLTFYTAGQFPPEYRGDAFVALHGSWNRASRTGYKVIRLPMKDGAATGVYEDFMTGMVAGDAGVWARPVGVAVAHDGALLVTEDLHGIVWRVSYDASR
jgi:glucose/arabinose dehydrogenase